MMAEETGIQTQTEAVSEVVTETTNVEATETVAETSTVNETATDTTESVATIPFSKEDLDWSDLGFDDAVKDELVNKYSGWFKDKESANSYLKALAEANKNNKEAQAKKIAEQDAAWEKALKTDADFGKDYDVNKKKVMDLVSKYSSEEELAEFKKFGFDKSPLFNRMMLKIANQFADARVQGAGLPPVSRSSQPTDRFGNTMFDFTKKQ